MKNNTTLLPHPHEKFIDELLKTYEDTLTTAIVNDPEELEVTKILLATLAISGDARLPKNLIRKLQYLLGSLPQDAVLHDAADYPFHLRLYMLVKCTGQLDKYSRLQQWPENTKESFDTWNEVLSLMLVESNILCQPQVYCMDLFDFLHGRNYVAMNCKCSFPEEISILSDINICIRREDLEDTERYISLHPFTAAVQRRTYSTGCNYQISTTHGLRVDLSLNWNYKFRNLQLIDTNILLATGRFSRGGIRKPALEMEFAYTWLLYMLNQLPVPEKLQLRFMQVPETDRDKLNRYFIREWKITGLLHYAFAFDPSPELNVALKTHLRSLKYNRGFSRLANTLGYHIDQMLNYFWKDPLMTGQAISHEDSGAIMPSEQIENSGSAEKAGQRKKSSLLQYMNGRLNPSASHVKKSA